MKQSTLCFLVKRKGGQITKVCLAMKKRGFGEGKWNGVGGKPELDESVEQASIRETKEEVGVDLLKQIKVAEIKFIFPYMSEWDQVVHIYLSENWDGEPTESEEMRPKWFNPESLPFDSMWNDDPHWLPLILEGKKLRARFVFSEGEQIKEKAVKIVGSLEISKEINKK